VANAIGSGLEGSPILAGDLAEKLAAVERSRQVSDADSADGEALPSGGPYCGDRSACASHQLLIEPDVGIEWLMGFTRSGGPP